MEKMKVVIVFTLCSALLMPVQVFSASVPLYQVTVVQNSAKAINYRYLKSSTMIDFKGTVLMANAKGSAEIKSKAGATEIDAEFQDMTAATQYGPEYLTYVLWAISPEGRPTNLGELILKNGKSELKVTEQLQAFGLLVTAEPYFAVSEPSNVVVLENAIRSNTKGKIESIDAKYELLQRGQYQVNIAPSELGLVMDEKTPLAIYEARNALRIAKAAGAETYATDAYNKAQQLLAQAENKDTAKKDRPAMARESVQRSEDARLVSVKRQEVASLATERQDAKNQINTANGAANTAALAQAQAETATAQAQLAKGQSDAARTAAEAATNVAQGQVAQAEGEKALLRQQLLQQFNTILQTRESARGLIVNMSGVLFETGHSDLRPLAREKLAKISGIVLAHPGLKLEVEGHTDSIGSDAYNQTLSENRARGARSYLVSQGVSADAIVSRGFGSKQPIASNDTADGRQSNRRVELIVSGDVIQIPVKAEAN